jgi:saccharopine dehydrogenase (NADP+, L-glutamate forming)
MKRVLVLGSGLVAGPLIRYLLDKGYEVVIGTLLVERARELTGGHAHARVELLNVEDGAALDRFIADADLTVSLLPFTYHPRIAERCIAHKKHMVTTSYVSPAMEALDATAKAAGVTLLNEIGVDPGIDHMSAMRVIDAVKTRGGRVTAFRSYCGGLPAPEANDNPFGYKFSWAPRGVLLASRNGAQFLLDERRVEVSPENLFREMQVIEVPGAGFFEAYPNRDSTSYIDIYGLAGIQTIFRGTLRNMGWCDTLYSYRKLGLLELDELKVKGRSYGWLLRKVLGAGPKADLAEVVAKRLGVHELALPVASLKWLGAFGTRKLKVDRISTLDALGALMFEKLAYAPGERDMLVMFHDFRVSYPDGRREQVTSSMIDFGLPGGDSSMARTVSLPAAIGVDLILRGRCGAVGVRRPVTPDIYGPVLDELKRLKIECKEKSTSI